MPKCFWRSECYVYNYRRKEFLSAITTLGPSHRPRDPGMTYCRWTPTVRLAHAYRDPDRASAAAERINREIYHHDNRKYPCAPVQMVTGEAARCLELINRRDNP